MMLDRRPRGLTGTDDALAFQEVVGSEQM